MMILALTPGLVFLSGLLQSLFNSITAGILYCITADSRETASRITADKRPHGFYILLNQRLQAFVR